MGGDSVSLQGGMNPSPGMQIQDGGPAAGKLPAQGAEKSIEPSGIGKDVQVQGDVKLGTRSDACAPDGNSARLDFLTATCKAFGFKPGEDLAYGTPAFKKAVWAFASGPNLPEYIRKGLNLGDYETFFSDKSTTDRPLADSHIEKASSANDNDLKAKFDKVFAGFNPAGRSKDEPGGGIWERTKVFVLPMLEKNEFGFSDDELSYLKMYLDRDSEEFFENITARNKTGTDLDVLGEQEKSGQNKLFTSIIRSVLTDVVRSYRHFMADGWKIPSENQYEAVKECGPKSKGDVVLNRVWRQTPHQNTCFMMCVLNGLVQTKRGVSYLQDRFQEGGKGGFKVCVGEGEKVVDFDKGESFEGMLHGVYRDHLAGKKSRVEKFGEMGNVEDLSEVLGLSLDKSIPIGRFDDGDMYQAFSIAREVSDALKQGKVCTLFRDMHYRTISAVYLDQNGRPMFQLLDSNREPPQVVREAVSMNMVGTEEGILSDVRNKVPTINIFELPSGDRKARPNNPRPAPQVQNKALPPVESVSPFVGPDGTFVDEVIVRLQDAAVREVSGDRFKKAYKLLADVSKATGTDASAVIKALKSAQAKNKSLGKKTGFDLAQSWEYTQSDDPAHPSGDKARFVETTADANADAASLLTQFVNDVREKGELSDDVLRQLDWLDDDLATGLTCYSRDVIRLAEDMRELCMQIMKTRVKGSRPVRADVSSGEALLDRTLAQLARSAAAAATELSAVRDQLGAISRSLRLLDGSSATATEALSVDLLNQVDELRQKLFALKGGNGAMKRELVKTLSDTRAALVSYRKSADRIQAGDSLRESPVLLSVFQGRFDTEFYLHCREQDIPAEMIDPTFASSRLRRMQELGNGAQNVVYATEHTKLGAYDQTKSGVFKFDKKHLDKKDRAKEDLDKKDLDKKHSDTEDVSVLFRYDPRAAGSENGGDFKISKLNYATKKAARQFFDAGDRFVDVSAGFLDERSEKTFGFVMGRAPGRTIRTTRSDIQKQNKQEKTDREILMRELRGMSRERQVSAATEIMLQGNDIDWSDYLTGQVDRHFGNVMLDLAPESPRPHVTLTGIDNDYSFSPRRIGLTRFQFPADELQQFLDKTNKKCPGLRSKLNKGRLDSTGALTPIKDKGDKPVSYVLDVGKLPQEYQWVFNAIGLSSMRLPSFITSETLAHLEKMRAQIDAHDKDKNAVDPFKGFSELVPESGLGAMRQRFDELYEHAMALKTAGKVFSRENLLRADPAQAEANLMILLEASKKQQAVVRRNFRPEISRSRVYDFGYAILDRLGFFLEGGVGKPLLSSMEVFRKFGKFVELYKAGPNGENHGLVPSDLGDADTRADLQVSVRSLFAHHLPDSIRSALEAVPIVDRPLTFNELNTVMLAIREYNLDRLVDRMAESVGKLRAEIAKLSPEELADKNAKWEVAKREELSLWPEDPARLRKSIRERLLFPHNSVILDDLIPTPFDLKNFAAELKQDLADTFKDTFHKSYSGFYFDFFNAMRSADFADMITINGKPQKLDETYDWAAAHKQGKVPNYEKRENDKHIMLATQGRSHPNTFYAGYGPLVEQMQKLIPNATAREFITRLMSTESPVVLNFKMSLENYLKYDNAKRMAKDGERFTPAVFSTFADGSRKTISLRTDDPGKISLSIRLYQTPMLISGDNFRFLNDVNGARLVDNAYEFTITCDAEPKTDENGVPAYTLDIRHLGIVDKL